MILFRRSFLLFLLIPAMSLCQNTAPCSQPECRQFDFWLGQWDLHYNDTAHATNHIVKDLNGCVIEEQFNDPNQKFSGRSWSVYNPASHQWQQTWVDNQGGYIVLTGAFQNDTMALYAESKKQQDGTISRKRMLYYNIRANSLDWNWETTADDGNSWKVLWKIHYSRLP
jgi:hypothetical protein